MLSSLISVAEPTGRVAMVRGGDKSDMVKGLPSGGRVATAEMLLEGAGVWAGSFFN